MNCLKCNKDIPSDSVFCPYCGEKYTRVNEKIAPIFEMAKDNMVNSIKTNIKRGIVDQYQDDDYGYVSKKPIFTLGINGSEMYLKSLRGSNGEIFRWVRRGSMIEPSIGGAIDIYDGYLGDNTNKVVTLFINIYGTNNSTYAPKGFYLLNADGSKATASSPNNSLVKPTKRKKVMRGILVGAFVMVALFAVVFVMFSLHKKHLRMDYYNLHPSDEHPLNFHDGFYSIVTDDGREKTCEVAYYFDSNKKTFVCGNQKEIYAGGYYSYAAGELTLTEYDGTTHKFTVYEDSIFDRYGDLPLGDIPEKTKFNASITDDSRNEIVFFDDGSVTVNGEKGKYERNGYMIVATIPNGLVDDIYQWTVAGNRLYQNVFYNSNEVEDEVKKMLEYANMLYTYNFGSFSVSDEFESKSIKTMYPTLVDNLDIYTYSFCFFYDIMSHQHKFDGFVCSKCDANLRDATITFVKSVDGESKYDKELGCYILSMSWAGEMFTFFYYDKTNELYGESIYSIEITDDYGDWFDSSCTIYIPPNGIDLQFGISTELEKNGKIIDEKTALGYLDARSGAVIGISEYDDSVDGIYGIDDTDLISTFVSLAFDKVKMLADDYNSFRN